jgi:vacuolar-type H+-ATPase subunit F/Vma7
MKIGNSTTQTHDNEQTPADCVQQAIQDDDDTDALLIHEYLMEQYAETFEKLAQ